MKSPPLHNAATDLPVLLPARITPKLSLAPTAYADYRWTIALLLMAVVLPIAAVQAQTVQQPELGVFATLVKWMPLVFKGFLFNLLVSVLAMFIGTVSGLMLGLSQLSQHRSVRRVAWALTQFFRNAPWLVLLFYAVLTIPFEITVFGTTIPFPAWIKAVIGLSLPVAANVSEIVRGGVQSIPIGQWDSAESLAFTRRQTLWQIILPQAIKRMLPPWMNLYAVLTMATTLISIVGVDESLSYARAALNAEGRPDLLLPMYGFLLALFFIYCFPVALWTARLERRYNVIT